MAGEQSLRRTVYGVQCPSCDRWISAYVPASKTTETVPTLIHDDPICDQYEARKFEDNFLGDLRSKLRVIRGKANGDC